MLLDALKRNKPELELDYESRSILGRENPFVKSLRKFEGEKALTRYFESKNEYVKPKEITIRVSRGKPFSTALRCGSFSKKKT